MHPVGYGKVLKYWYWLVAKKPEKTAGDKGFSIYPNINLADMLQNLGGPTVPPFEYITAYAALLVIMYVIGYGYRFV